MLSARDPEVTDEAGVQESPKLTEKSIVASEAGGATGWLEAVGGLEEAVGAVGTTGGGL